MVRPFISEIDPATSSEGSLDPVGLYQIADALATLLVPGVRERQSRPRFLTAIAVSMFITENYDAERVAKDGVSQPWQVFEWYMVEGLVRSSGEEMPDHVPGRLKVEDAIRAGVPVSAPRYLKTPNVFGFHGVYRTLARELGIDCNARLGEQGHELLSTWANEQGLHGFHTSLDGDGKAWRDSLRAAVEEGLKQGATARSGAWQGWEFFERYMNPARPGTAEASCISDMLLDESRIFRRAILAYLTSTEGSRVWLDSRFSEKLFHDTLMRQAEPQTLRLLETIAAYETFSQLLTNAFEECLWKMSATKRKVSLKELMGEPGVKKAHDGIPELFIGLCEKLDAYSLAQAFQERFTSIAEKADAASWVQKLLDHHVQVQRAKPPMGKMAWFERFDDGGLMIRPLYIRHEQKIVEEQYVHGYRTNALWSFAQDLKMVP